MCGIFGVLGKSTPQQRELLITLNQDRGEDAIGVLYWHDKKNKPMLWKKAMSPIEALASGSLPERCLHSKWMVGHTRNSSDYSTAKKDECAHPFLYRSTIVAHNGFISNWRPLKTEVCKELKIPWEIEKNIDIDSQLIPIILNHMGADGLKRMEGWAACWFVFDNKLYLWNSRGYLAAIQRKDVLAFSSDKRHLRRVFGKEGMQEIPDDGTMVVLDPDTMTINPCEDKFLIKKSESKINHSTGQVYHGAQTIMGLGLPASMSGAGSHFDDDPRHFHEMYGVSKFSGQHKAKSATSAFEPFAVTIGEGIKAKKSDLRSAVTMLYHFYPGVQWCPECRCFTAAIAVSGDGYHQVCNSKVYQPSHAEALKFVAESCQAMSSEEWSKLMELLGTSTSSDVANHMCEKLLDGMKVEDAKPQGGSNEQEAEACGS